MPVLKQLVSTSSSKRRSRLDLTAEMISAPLGDFRHTMHVGRGGDAFGDTSFLSTRSREPPREPEVPQSPPKQSLLSRAFRSSKRSQSINHNKPEKSKVPPPGGSLNYIKSAVSLPFLNEADAVHGGGKHFPKSVSSSPVKQLPEKDRKTQNGAAALVTELELHEKRFGELTDLRPSVPYAGGMKHAESIMSFHIDLGPSMLGDILSVMDKKGWEDTDLTFEEVKSEGPPQSPPNEVEEEDHHPPVRPPHLKTSTNPYTPEILTKNHQHLDSCSGSTVPEEKHLRYLHEDNMKHRVQDDRDFSCVDDEDEIRV